MYDPNELELDYAANIADAETEEEHQQLRQRIEDMSEHLEYEVSKEHIALVPAKMDDRITILLHTASKMVDAWKQSSNMNEPNWDLYCVMSHAIQMVTYFSNCTTLQEGEPIAYDLMELERRLKTMLSMVQHTKRRFERSDTDE